MGGNNQNHDSNRLHFWLALAVFIIQSVGTIFFLGAKTQGVQDELSFLKRDLGRIESAQIILVNLTQDVAVLKVKMADTEKQIDKLYINRSSR